jgi:hypothetical protein
MVSRVAVSDNRQLFSTSPKISPPRRTTTGPTLDRNACGKRGLFGVRRSWANSANEARQRRPHRPLGVCSLSPPTFRELRKWPASFDPLVRSPASIATTPPRTAGPARRGGRCASSAATSRNDRCPPFGRLRRSRRASATTHLVLAMAEPPWRRRRSRRAVLRGLGRSGPGPAC